MNKTKGCLIANFATVPFKMLRSSAAILHGINNLRNNYSMAHPTETLLNEADARFAINLVRSIMTYVDELL
ncbi:abortive infection family protein [Escherichia coli]|uniref:abortive infection family protein n=1 Tax=Escherichia coli TaxID=562 RepID=UPI0020234585|nr:abortive infection family protein [Escherichia coli]